MKTPRAYGRGNEAPRHGKAKARGSKHESVSGSTKDGNHVATAEEVVEKTLKRLRTLGSQRFASSPYSEHFNRWLMNLTDVLSEFESNPNIGADDQFLRERSRILSEAERTLEERHRREASLEEAIKDLSDSKSLLARIKRDYASRAGEIERRKNSEIKRLNSNISSLREELVDVARMKTGLFRGVSKKAREQKETETTQGVDTKQRELELAMLDFTLAEEKLQDEYERKRQPIIEQIKDRQKKIEILETDGSLEDRWFACEALIDAVNALLQRKTQSDRRLFS
jgi:hypothetical protein